MGRRSRIEARPVEPVRVALMFDRKPSPMWRLKPRAKVVPVFFDGQYWIENLWMNGFRCCRVVRHGWPAFLPRHEPDTDLGWPGKMERAHGIFVQDLRVMPATVADSLWAWWPLMLLTAALAAVAFVDPIAAGLLAIPLALYARLLVRGGFGNVPIAKAMLGIRRPFLLTPYQLYRHVRSKAEQAPDELGVGEAA